MAADGAQAASSNANVEDSVEFAHKVIAEMARVGAPATPKNFEIWHAHLAGEKPKLSQELNKRLEAKKTITDDVSDELFNHHFANLRLGEEVVDITSQVERHVGDVVVALQASGKNTSAYGQALAGASGQLSRADNAESLRLLIDNLVKATKAMESHSRKLEVRLCESTEEIAKLRTNVEAMRVEAMTDPLTGVANRKYFDETLRRVLAECHDSETETPISLIMGDVDHFKRFNDTYGHQTGDQVLRLVAGVMSANVKGRDLVARFGGEEFAIVLPFTTMKDAARLAETIRSTVENKRLRKKSTNEDLGVVTLSLGVTQYSEGEDGTDLIERADENLYQAKESGRNRVCAIAPKSDAD